jgi:hypothetical protein
VVSHETIWINWFSNQIYFSKTSILRTQSFLFLTAIFIYLFSHIHTIIRQHWITDHQFEIYFESVDSFWKSSNMPIKMGNWRLTCPFHPLKTATSFNRRKKKQKKKNKWKCERNDTYTAGGKIARIENLNDESSEDKTFSG